MKWMQACFSGRAKEFCPFLFRFYTLFLPGLYTRIAVKVCERFNKLYVHIFAQYGAYGSFTNSSFKNFAQLFYLLLLDFFSCSRAIALFLPRTAKQQNLCTERNEFTANDCALMLPHIWFAGSAIKTRTESILLNTLAILSSWHSMAMRVPR